MIVIPQLKYLKKEVIISTLKNHSEESFLEDIDLWKTPETDGSKGELHLYQVVNVGKQQETVKIGDVILAKEAYLTPIKIAGVLDTEYFKISEEFIECVVV